MNSFAQTALLVGVIVAAVSLALGSLELRRIRHFLMTGRIKVELVPVRTSDSTEQGVLGSGCGYAVFVFRQGRWVLEADLSKPGYEAASPTIPGAYEGQAVKKESGLKGQG